jgi:hypothetical protein
MSSMLVLLLFGFRRPSLCTTTPPGVSGDDIRARELTRSDHFETAEDAPHHVITKYQRGPFEKGSLKH